MHRSHGIDAPLRMQRWLVALLLALSAMLAWRGAHAELRKLSEYEKETLRRALEQTGHAIDPHPEGKWIEEIEVVSFEVFDEQDFLPTRFPTPSFNLADTANWFHTLSRPWVIRREVLLRPGQRYDASLVNESERNLRVRQISVVLIAPVRGSTPDRVRLLVIAKDVWSLRVNFEPRFVNGKLDFIALQPSEENLFGLHKTVTGLLQISRATYSLGLGFIDPRVMGTRLQATGSANLIFNCDSNNAEGSFGSFSYGKPLYSTRTRWSWTAAIAWDSRIVRPAGPLGTSICSGGPSVPIELPGTPEGATPFEYDQDVLRSQFSVARSYGIWLKNDLSFGLESRRVMAEPREGATLSPLGREQFRLRLPTSDTRLGPFVQLHAYRNRFHRVVDIETLGLQEDYQLGHDVWFRMYPAARALGSSRDMLGVFNGIAYTAPLADGLVRWHVDHSAELARADGSDAAVGGGLRLMTPRVTFVRGVVDVLGSHRYINYLNPLSVIGGTDRLRGYRMNAFVGPDVIAGNFELRTMPLRLPGALVGAVGFWDVGDAFSGFDDLALKHAYGGGLRVLLPQLDRAVFRIDVGFPLDPSVPGAERTIIAQFRQAFPMPRVLPPSLVPSTFREGVTQ
jgi:hypothetical protein